MDDSEVTIRLGHLAWGSWIIAVGLLIAGTVWHAEPAGQILERWFIAALVGAALTTLAWIADWFANRVAVGHVERAIESISELVDGTARPIGLRGNGRGRA